MRLVEKGFLALGQSTGAIIPELSMSQVLLGFDKMGQPLLCQPKEPITILHLLTHTAGYIYEIWN